MTDLTFILNRVQHDDPNAPAELLPLVYEELRRLAALKMAAERPGQTLQPTALVHEAWLKLSGSTNQQWANRRHFVAAAAEAMRRILIDRARKRNRTRHGQGLVRISLTEVDIATETDDETLLALDEALTRLAQDSPERAELVKLRYFVGLSLPEAARALGISESTAKRQWNYIRARLFRELIQICHAVQHAHQKGIIHRDIKPSNVLVTLHDGVPVPKVIDFGIAKATNQKLTEKTLFTRFATTIGTPAYMSPEQAEMSGLDVDTRTDVYALGVLLYQLLTGTTPFSEKRLLSLGYGEMQRVILEEEPERPSTRLSTLDNEQKTIITHNCGQELSSLANLLRGDLDWVVMKCLEKNRARRYETANGLASDIQRHLNNEPVIARPPSAAYRLQKMLRRNKTAFAAALIVAGTLLLGTTISSLQAVLATRARNEAKKSEQRALEAALQERQLQQRSKEQAEVIRQNLYASEMVLGIQALEAKNLGFARELLDRHRPQPGQADLRRWEWRYLWAATRSDAALEAGSHSNHVDSITFSPQGNLVASSGGDRTVRLWSSETGREVALLLHSDPVRASAFSSDGKMLATACVDGNLRRWDIATRTEISRTPVGVIDHLTGKGCSFSVHGERFASSEEDGTVNVWDVASGSKIATFHAAGFLFCTAFSRDGTLLAGGCHLTNLVEVWDIRTRHRVGAIATHIAPVVALAFSPNGKTLAVGNNDGIIKIWDIATQQPVRTLHGHTSWVSSMDYSVDGGYLASASGDHTAILWNLETGEQRTLYGHLNEVLAIAFSPDGETLATGTREGHVAFWNVRAPAGKRSGEALRVLGDYERSPSLFSSDGSALLRSFDDQRTFAVWNVLKPRETSRFTVQRDPGSTFALSPAGKLLAIGSSSGSIRLLNAGTSEIARFNTFNTSKAAVRRLVFSRDGRHLAAQTGDWRIQVWDVGSERSLLVVDGHSSHIVPQQSSFRFSPDGSRLAAGYGDGSTEILDLPSGRRVAHLKAHKSSVSGVALFPDGKTVATASYDQSVKLWDLGTQRELATFHGEWLACFALAVSPDGRTVAAGGAEGTIRLWDAGTRQLVGIIKGIPGEPVWDLSFSPDGDDLFAITRNDLRIWHAPRLTEIDARENKAEER